MKTRILIILGFIGIITAGIILSNFYLYQEDFAVYLCDKWFFSDSGNCTRIWGDPDCFMPGGGCIYPKKAPFEQFVEKKAIMVFNLKLEEYDINSKVDTVHSAYSTGIKKAFITQAAYIDDSSHITRYYMTTSFDPNESLDKINVEIYKIISEKCIDLVFSGLGCESKYLEKIEIPKDYWISGENESDWRFTENED